MSKSSPFLTLSFLGIQYVEVCEVPFTPSQSKKGQSLTFILLIASFSAWIEEDGLVSWGRILIRKGVRSSGFKYYNIIYLSKWNHCQISRWPNRLEWVRQCCERHAVCHVPKKEIQQFTIHFPSLIRKWAGVYVYITRNDILTRHPSNSSILIDDL